MSSWCKILPKSMHCPFYHYPLHYGYKKTNLPVHRESRRVLLQNQRSLRLQCHAEESSAPLPAAEVWGQRGYVNYITYAVVWKTATGSFPETAFARPGPSRAFDAQAWASCQSLRFGGGLKGGNMWIRYMPLRQHSTLTLSQTTLHSDTLSGNTQPANLCGMIWKTVTGSFPDHTACPAHLLSLGFVL